MSKKVALITGGSSGIGEALCFVFGKAGYCIVFSGRNTERLSAVEHKLATAGVDALAVQADGAKEEDVRRLIDETVAKFGRIDVLINNAGISMRALVADLDLEVIRKVMDINFWGTVYATKYALPHIVKTKGSIVGVSSIAGLKGLPARSGYSASKFAMHGFLETLRIEMRPKGVHVYIFAPWFTGTNIRKTALTADGSPQGKTPRKEEKMVTAQQAAQAIYKGVQKRKRLTVHTFKGKLMIFLNKWFPATMDKIVYNQMAKEPDSPFK